MPNLLNVPEVLTFEPGSTVFKLHVGQALLRGGPVAQPIFGLKKPRPAKGQLWPRSEFQRDRYV
jgi:hypothetical protein